MMSINDLRSRYNELLIREKRGEEYLDGAVRTSDEVDKWMPEFKKILVELNSTLGQIGSFTIVEALNGFNL